MKKKIAVVTGASRGIGKAVSLNLASQNYHVILLARSPKPLSEVQQEIINLKGTADVCSVDVTDPGAIDECISNVFTRYHRIDFLFNNAGVWFPGTSEVDPANLRQMVDVNLLGAIFVANAVARFMKKQRSGYIVNLASIAGKIGFDSEGGYCASKFGLVGFAESLSNELKPYDVKVTTICPSYVKTDMTDYMSAEKRELMIRPEDINTTINFLLQLHPNVAIKEVVMECRYRSKIVQ